MSTITTTLLNNIETQLANPNPDIFIIPYGYIEDVDGYGLLTSYNSIKTALLAGKLCLVQTIESNDSDTVAKVLIKVNYYGLLNFVTELDEIDGETIIYYICTLNSVWSTNDPTASYVYQIQEEDQHEL